MSIATEYLIKINNQTLPKIKNITVQRAKLWTDAGRNMQGDLRATFIGIFPKIILDFTPLTETELSSILSLLDNSQLTVEWYDEKTDTYKTGYFYTNDFNYKILRKDKGIYEGFAVTLIPFNKMQ